MHPEGINWIWECPVPPTPQSPTRSTRTDKHPGPLLHPHPPVGTHPPTPPRPPLFQSCLAEMSDAHPAPPTPTYLPHPVGAACPSFHSLTHTQHQQHSESQHSSWIQLFPWQPRFLHVWNETESAKGPLPLIQRLAIDWSSLQPHTYPPAEHVHASAHPPSANIQHQNGMWCRKAPGGWRV